MQEEIKKLESTVEVLALLLENAYFHMCPNSEATYDHEYWIKFAMSKTPEEIVRAR